VDFVAPVVELPARTITVKAVVRNPRRELRPGMFIEARLALVVKPRATVIPEDAVLPVEGATYVWLVQDNVVSRRQVSLGIRTPGFVEVTDGVQPGDLVVVGGLERMTEGAPVAVTVVERE
jgi:membrane fusion protein (multidrug efflux system)